MGFADYRPNAHAWITVFDSEVYPDFLDAAKTVFEPVQQRFIVLATDAESSGEFLKAIANEPNPVRTQLMRLFRRYVSMTQPGATYTNFSYDAEDEPTAYTFTLGGSPRYDTLFYTVTGQLGYGVIESGNTGTPAYFFDGVKLTFDGGRAPQAFQDCGYSTSTVVDARNLLVIGTSVSGQGVVSNSYDADGRITQTTEPALSGCEVLSQSLKTYAYDAEDHTTFTFDVGLSNIHYYSWGPIGHPVTVGECYVIYQPGGSNCLSAQNGPWRYEALHWAGNQLLFTTRADGALTDYKIGGDGDDLPTDQYHAGVTYYDRDMSGQIRSGHNAAGASKTTGAYGGDFDSPMPNFYDASAGTTFTYQRLDGITDGSSTLQGVRSYSPDTLQWTTPDAFGGDTSDPMSQSKYIWNRNNPMAYSDPTGYVVTFSHARGDDLKKYYKAKAYLQKTGAGRTLFAKMDDPSTSVIVRFNHGMDDSSPLNTHQINWDPEEGNKVASNESLSGESGIQSPALQLLHEADHATSDNWTRVQNTNIDTSQMRGPIRYYGNMEEARVITGSETNAAQALGEPARICWCGESVYSSNVTP